MFTPSFILPNGCSFSVAKLLFLIIVSILSSLHFCQETSSLVKGILLIANKYEISSVHEMVVHYLETQWPQNLWEWDRLKRDSKQVSQLWMGESEEVGQPSTCTKWYGLTIADLLCLMRACVNLMKVALDLLNVSIPLSRHHWSSTCVPNTQQCLWEIIRYEATKTLDILATLLSFIELAPPHCTNNICCLCLTAVRGRLMEVRHKIWNKLPELFELDNIMW